MTKLRLAGMEPLTTVEWPGRLAAVLFFQGCPWRCRYCHNAGLVRARAANLKPWAEAMEFLRQRQGFLDSVILSGGEPLFQPRLLEAAEKVRALGYDVALHTNGYDPEHLARLLASGFVQMVSMDVKAPFNGYERVTRRPDSGDAARRSVEIVLASGVPYEFRTTYHQDLLSAQDLRTIAADLHALGAQTYYLQAYRDEGSPDMALQLSPVGTLDPVLVVGIRRLFPTFGLRGFSAVG
ncbi:MAG: anaerobic ribonucleoside-triphosphate reductase activating protein [Armatimonadetes bacterium]|nr:anaerobic ribonucleoside-triphosphate reductase activating protein [Armatimonadota bacterium]